MFGTLTLVLHDETFIKVKPTIIYGLFAAVLGGGLLFGRSFIAIMFDQMFNLTPQGWRMLTMRWALFFVAMAILNEIIWRTQTTDFGVAFKAFVVIPLTMAFAIAADAADRSAIIWSRGRCRRARTRRRRVEGVSACRRTQRSLHHDHGVTSANEKTHRRRVRRCVFNS